MTIERVLVAEPRGFCAGVEMAIKALTWMTRIFDGPVYCYHEIVHNEWVVKAFEGVGVVFVGDIDDVPEGARSCFRLTAQRPRWWPEQPPRRQWSSTPFAPRHQGPPRSQANGP